MSFSAHCLAAHNSELFVSGSEQAAGLGGHLDEAESPAKCLVQLNYARLLESLRLPVNDILLRVDTALHYLRNLLVQGGNLELQCLDLGK